MLPKMAEALHNYYYFPFAAVEVAVAETHYQVKEGFEARVCVTLISENSGCVVPFPLLFIYLTIDGRGIFVLKCCILGDVHNFAF